jgi:phosphoenolpyruvate carboxylase
MSDLNTKEDVVGILKSECTLKKVLREGKVCPFAGSSKNDKICPTCTNDWMGVAGKIQDKIEKRRANYEAAEQKMKLISSQMDGIREAMEKMSETTGVFADIFQKAIGTFADTMKGVADKIPEKKTRSSKKTAKVKKDDSGTDG